MQLRKAFLVLAVVLFVGWMAYLIHLALTHRHPTVLSRPQFLVSRLVIVTHFESKDAFNEPAVKTYKVLFKAKGLESLNDTVPIKVANLKDCAQYWSEPGDYLLPLEKSGDAFIVTLIPRSPGYPRAGENMNPLIYRWTAETKEQFKHIAKPEGAVLSGR